MDFLRSFQKRVYVGRFVSYIYKLCVSLAERGAEKPQFKNNFYWKYFIRMWKTVNLFKSEHLVLEKS